MTLQKTRKTDKICFVEKDDRTERDIMVIEYKAAHKLTPQLLSQGLQLMNLAEVINRATISTDQQKRDEEFAQQAMASVITQTFDYMVDKGVCYGYITGGQAYVFHYFHQDDPNTLYYHSAVLSTPPSAEAFPYPEAVNRCSEAWAVGCELVQQGLAARGCELVQWGLAARGRTRSVGHFCSVSACCTLEYQDILQLYVSMYDI